MKIRLERLVEICVAGFLIATPTINPRPQVKDSSSILEIINDSYIQLKKDVENKRTQYYLKYLSADSLEKKGVINSSRDYLFSIITNDFFHAWNGTAWSFNGTSEKPRHGQIACGYFVTTILRDVGFNIDRTKLAQQPSLLISKVFDDSTKIFRGNNLAYVEKHISERGRGIYIYGHDCGVGFAFCDGKNVYVENSTHYTPAQVVQTPIAACPEIINSGIAVFGEILSEENIIKWLNCERIE